MKKFLISTVFVVTFLGHGILLADQDPDKDPTEENTRSPFYPQHCFDHRSAPDVRYDEPAEQMKLLRELGYDGYAHSGIDGLPEVLESVDKNHLKLYQFHVYASLDPDKPKYDSRLKETLLLLKGRETVVSLLIEGKTSSPAEWERLAVEIAREIADMASASHLRVAILPYYKTVQDVVRVAQKTDRKNVGVIFSQVFFCLTEDEKNLESTLELAMPYLYAVNINGVESGYKGTDFPRLIQTLDRGNFDNLKLLKPLRELGYTGPIGLHCCYIPGDVRDILTRSMGAWKKLSARLNAPLP